MTGTGITTDAAAADWKAWRRAERQRLLAQRATLSVPERRARTERLAANLDSAIEGLPVRVLGLYWPIKRELNLLDWAGAAATRRNLALALPVVVQPRAPLEYWRWHPSTRMTRGFWNIPVPEERAVVHPDTVLAPLVGFQGCWRLGYGGGYFDRTLAAHTPQPVAIGVGLDGMEIAGFVPQPHDVPMSLVVTESRIIRTSREP